LIKYSFLRLFVSASMQGISIFAKEIISRTLAQLRYICLVRINI